MSDPSLVRRLKQRYRRARLRRLGVVETRRCPSARIGAGSGAWVACLDNLNEHSIVYSFGVGTDISFDLELNRLTGAQVHLFDPTPRSVAWVREQSLPDGVRFHAYGVGGHDGSIEFFPPRRAASSHFSPVRRYRTAPRADTVTATVLRLSSIAARLGHDRIALMKMDIEGGEYEVIADMADNPPPVDQLLVEFHHAYATIPVSRTIEAVARLSALGFDCFDISDRTYEMSFIAR